MTGSSTGIGVDLAEKDAYFLVQRIYYPGFTLAGCAEPLTALSTIALLVVLPHGSAFWLTLVAVVGSIGVQVTYWVLVHALNKAWLRDERLDRFSSGFFGAAAGPDAADWAKLRNRWEYAHLTRAILAMLTFLALVLAM